MTFRGITLRNAGYMLRPFESSDAEAFVEAVLESQATVGKWMPWATPTYSTQDALHWFADCEKSLASGSSYEFGIFEESSGEFVGGTGLNQINPRARMCNFGYWVRESKQNRGAASAAVRMLKSLAFGSLGLSRAEIVVSEGNTASMKVAERAGAVHECVARNRLIIDGAPSPAHVYSLIPDG